MEVRMEGRIDSYIKVSKGVAYQIFTYTEGDIVHEHEYLLKKFPKKDRSNGAGMRAKGRKCADAAYEENLVDFTKQCQDIIHKVKQSRVETDMKSLAKKHSDLTAWTFEYDAINKLEGKKKVVQAEIKKVNEDLLKLKKAAVENTLRTKPSQFGLTKENVEKFIKEYLWQE